MSSRRGTVSQFKGCAGFATTRPFGVAVVHLAWTEWTKNNELGACTCVVLIKTQHASSCIRTVLSQGTSVPSRQGRNGKLGSIGHLPGLNETLVRIFLHRDLITVSMTSMNRLFVSCASPKTHFYYLASV